MNENDFNLIFMPGGPGFGSEYYLPWLNVCNIKDANIWLLDFPGDGSNIDNVEQNCDNWQKEFIPAISSLNNIILVAHSFAGMFALSIKELEHILSGLILLSTYPDSGWANGLPQRMKEHDLPERAEERDIYNKQRTNANLRDFVLAGWKYLVLDKTEAFQLLSELPYNHLTYDWGQEKFHPYFSASWIPEKLPTLIVSGEQDFLTPIDGFKNDLRFARSNIKIITIENASHFPWVEKPEELLDIIDSFKNSIAN